MRLVPLNEEKIEISGQGNTKFIRMRSGQPEDDDFDDLVSIMDQLFDMLSSTKYRQKFKTSTQHSLLKEVSKKFDRLIDKIREVQSNDS